MNDPIDQGKRKEGSISSLLDNYLSKFKIIQSPRLFDVDETKFIKQGICPVCECKLKVSMKGDVYCSSKRHMSMTKKKLFITREGMKKLK